MKALILPSFTAFLLVTTAFSQVQPGRSPKSGTMKVRKTKNEAVKNVETNDIIKEMNIEPMPVTPYKKGKRASMK